MRVVIFLFVAVLAACTRHNPDACCTSQSQCDMLGMDQLYPCSDGRVCDMFGACQQPQCGTSADCAATPDRPVCANQLCVAACTGDPDCTGLGDLTHCASDGVCVGCLTNDDCTATAPACDADTRTCRGCEADSECASGVCLEDEGTCADASRIIFVRNDGFDSGACDAGTPCRSLAYALGKVTPTRDVIHLLSAATSVGMSGLDVTNRRVRIDGAPTLVTRDTQGAVIASGPGTAAVLTGLSLGTSSGTSLSVGGGTVTLFDARVLGAIEHTAGTLATKSSMLDGQLSSSSSAAVLILESTTIHQGVFTTNVAMVTIVRSYFDGAEAFLSMQGASTITQVENNLFVSPSAANDPVALDGANGSVFRFNTLVNTSGIDDTAQPLDCTTRVVASSNIIAWHSSAPVNCPSKYSLFDSYAGVQPGIGNSSGDASGFFVDLAGKDFHLAAGSPAIDKGEPGVPVTVDFDGNPRPSPTGTNPDIGAYEAP